MLNVIRQWVIKTMMKNNTGVVQTLPKRDLIELNTQITAQRLMQNGIDPQSLKNVNQVENVVNQIDNPPKINIDTGGNQSGIRSTKSAKVMDMEGKEIKDPKNIMGGKEINQQTLNEELMKTDNPFSDLVKTTNQKPKTIKEREAEVLAGMEKNNKEAVQRIKNRKMLDDAIDNASPGFAGDRKYDAQLVADDLADKRFGKEFYDLDQKQQIDLYGEALDGLSDSKNLERQFFKDVDEAGGMEEFLNKNPIDDPEDMAQGGRAGYADGTPSFEEYMQERQGIEKKQNFERLYKEYLEDLRRKDVMEQKQMAADGGRIGLKAGMTKRAFLKLMGGAGAGIAALKSGLLGIGKGAGKQAAKEVVEQGVRSAPPPYFFELANKIKMLGKPDKVTYADRVEIHRYRGKNGDEYELIEDLNTGDVRITKDKTGIGSYGDKTFDTIEDRTVLDYRKGDVNVKDEGLETQKSFKEADEYEEYKVEFDQDGTEAGADDIAANVQKEIIEEAGGEAPSIKKAGGGIARMLGE